MATSPVQDPCKPARGPGAHRAALSPSPSPESSLTWCLSHLFKPDTSGGRETDKRSRAAQWRALVAIRTQHIKGGSAGIPRFRTQGGLRPLLDLLKHPGCSRKTLDIALSILANCCTELETQVEVRRLDGIRIVVDILKRNVVTETVQNRAARALGNLAMDSQNSALIHSAGGVALLLLCVSLCSTSSSPTAAQPKAPCPKLECAQSAARALLYLADTPSNRLLLLTQGALSALAPLIAPEYPQGLRRAALRTLHELTRGCGVECARDVSRSGVLAQLGVMASGEAGKPFEELALKTLANMCSQGCLRPLVGSLGVISKFAEEVKRDPLRSGLFFKALCLCCKEAVNRAKVKESGGLETLITFLAAHQSHPLSRLAILACVDFVYDESALEQLQELGLVPVLVTRLVELAKGEEVAGDNMDVSLTSSMSPTELLPSSCFDSFDFPPLEASRREEVAKEQGLGSSSFLSLRSWLVSEGLISSEGDLVASPGTAEGDLASLRLPSSSSPQTSLHTNCDSHISLKGSCLSEPSPSSSSTKQVVPPALECPVSSPWKQLGLSPSSPLLSSTSPLHPPSTGTPQIRLSSPSPLSPPTKTLQTPVSPTKFSSPQRKRPRVHPSARSAKVTVDAPPVASSVPMFQHPYHPEPWAPESPILLLLSRFSHATDPSAALVNSAAVSGLLFYLTRHQDPSSRCFRMLCRLSCNPNCLQALVRTGSAALIHHYLCQTDVQAERAERQTDRVKAKIRQLGLALLSNMRVQCESGFGSGVLAHVMLSGSESDKMNCALSLPLINCNKALLKKLLLDNGGLLLALQPIGCNGDDGEEDCGCLLPNCFNSPHLIPVSQLHSLYVSLLIGCLSSLLGGAKSELAKKSQNSVQTLSIRKTDGRSTPPLKKPRLDNFCSYLSSTFDLDFMLDDGSRLSANRDAIAGVEDTGVVGSEYFRALLRGGFEEAQGRTGRAVRIKDVSRGMLLPVLHYLHGCRLTSPSEQDGETGVGSKGRCEMLGSLAHHILGSNPGGREQCLREKQDFKDTPLAEMMTGASRFLVTELQKEAEDLYVSLLLTSPATHAAHPAPVEDVGRPPASDMDQERMEGESADESLAHRTSGLELGGVTAKTERRTDDHQPPASGATGKLNVAPGAAPQLTTITSAGSKSGSSHSPLPSHDTGSRPKNCTKTCRHALKLAAQGRPSSGAGAVDGTALALLPQVYWFSQRYSYPRLGRACLSLLLGCQGAPQPPVSSAATADCLWRLARGADCTETLKRDILALATTVLS